MFATIKQAFVESIAALLNDKAPPVQADDDDDDDDDDDAE